MVFQGLQLPAVGPFPAGDHRGLVFRGDGGLHPESGAGADLGAGGPDGRADAPILPGRVHQQAGEGPADEEAPEEEIADERAVGGVHFHHQEGGVPVQPGQRLPVEGMGVEPLQVLLRLAGKQRFQRRQVLFLEEREPTGGRIGLFQDGGGDGVHLAVPEAEERAIGTLDLVPGPRAPAFEGYERADHRSTSL